MRSATVLADMAVGYVINASQLEQAERTREQLQEALDSRIVIEQAKGMIANANGIGVDDAFQLLRRYARSQRKPLRAVASEVVESALDSREPRRPTTASRVTPRHRFAPPS